MKSQKCPYHVTFDLDLDLEHILDAGSSGTIVCKFGSDPATSVVEVAIDIIDTAISQITGTHSQNCITQALG